MFLHFYVTRGLPHPTVGLKVTLTDKSRYDFLFGLDGDVVT